MAGHSKWANIKHRKAGQDAKRGKIFTKLIRELTVAAKEGGADMGSNSRLRTAVEKALLHNMKRDTVDKAIARGSGKLEGQNFESIRYEGYAPSGIAVMIDCLSDNRLRTVAEVRHILSKNGGNLGTDGSVAYLFKKKGLFYISEVHNEDEILEIALENGADEVTVLDNKQIEVNCSTDMVWQLKQSLEKQNIEIISHEIANVADTLIDLNLEQTEKVLQLIDALEDLDDVQEVSSNLSINDDLIEQLNNN